jgi:hypothetical protein
LKFYIPTDQRHREVCYAVQLPREILKFLNISDRKAESVLKSVVGASNLDVLDDILRAEGIGEVDGVLRPSAPTSPTQSAAICTPDGSPSSFDDMSWISAFQTLSLHGGSPRSTPASPAPVGRSALSPPLFFTPSQQRTFASPAPVGRSALSSSSVFTSSRQRTPTSPAPVGRSLLSPASLFSPTSPRLGYTAILSHIIAAAGHATIPYSGRVYQSTTPTAWHLPHHFLSLTFPSNLDRDISVGAASELFAFELLSTLSLPAFNSANWQSRIRDRVCVHDKYADLTPWRGRETADLTYEDTEGAFTQLLMERGYLASGSVIAAPKYYLEVKTTTSNCEEAFYMSDNQYRMVSGALVEDGRYRVLREPR